MRKSTRYIPVIFILCTFLGVINALYVEYYYAEQIVIQTWITGDLTIQQVKTMIIGLWLLFATVVSAIKR